ncbi:MAG: trimethylamine methyltransferase family protein [Desulfurococcaceae archaeon]
MARPRIEVLSREELEEVHWRSLGILSRVGVKIDHAEALRLLKEAGAEVDFNSKTARIPEYLVKEALKKAPSSVRLYSRSGKNYLDLAGWSTYFVVGSTGMYYVDWRTNEVRRATSRDLAEVSRVADALPNTHMVSTALVPADVPEVLADRWRMYVVLKSSSKPIDTGAFTPEGVPDAVEIMAAVVGRENVSKKPFMIFAACPSPPLKWSSVAAQNLLDCARYGVPIHIIPMPQTGGTSPATLAGSLVQGNAEFLSGLVLAQLARPGAPVVYSCSPTVFEQRYGTSCTGSPEALLMAAGFSQLAKYYGLPSGGYVMVSDAKVFDEQAALESAMGALVAVLSGINMAIGSGMLLGENGISLLKLVVDDDVAGAALRIGRGVLVEPETLADKLIEEVGPGGLFLKYKHTREWWRREHFIPAVLDKRGLDMWRKAGSKDAAAAARELVEKILREHAPEPLPPDVERDLDRVMAEIAKKYGVEKLPSF